MNKGSNLISFFSQNARTFFTAILRKTIYNLKTLHFKLTYTNLTNNKLLLDYFYYLSS